MLYNEIDIVKIDIEGAEYEVLMDLIDKNLIEKAHSYIIEFHLQMNDFKKQSKLLFILKHFNKSGFNYTLKSNKMMLEGYQDILIYFRKNYID